MANWTPSYRPSRSGRLVSLVHHLVPVTVWLLCVTLVVWLGMFDDNRPAVVGIVSSQRASVVTPRAGRINAVTTALHQTVAQGQVLVRLDDTNLRLRLTKTNQELQILRAEIDKEQAQILAEASKEQSELQLDAVIERRRRIAKIESARLSALATRAEIEEVRIRAQGAAIESDRIASLAIQGFSSASELVQVRTIKDALNKRLTQLERLHEQQEARTRTFEEQLANFKPKASTPAGVETSLTPLRLKLQKQATELQEIEHLREQLLLRAPIPGQVTEIAITDGEWTSSGQVVATIVASKPTGIVAYVGSEQSQWLQDAINLEVQTQAREPLGQTNIRSISPTTVRVPRRLWRDPNTPEWAVAIELAPSGRERAGDLVTIVRSN